MGKPDDNDSDAKTAVFLEVLRLLTTLSEEDRESALKAVMVFFGYR